MVVQNISGDILSIPELQRIIPNDNKWYILPEHIAYRYKQYLKPIQRMDTPPPPPPPSSSKFRAKVIEIDLDAILNEEIPKIDYEHELNAHEIRSLRTTIKETISKVKKNSTASDVRSKKSLKGVKIKNRDNVYKKLNKIKENALVSNKKE